MVTEHRDARSFDIVVLGGGSATEALVRELAGSGATIAVIEARRVGGECPFVACMPSKSMLHDAAAGLGWEATVEHRDDVVDQLDDAGHARGLAETGATLLRARGRVTGPHTVAAGLETVCADHLVLATGSRAVIPPIDGLDELGDLVWTSDDALTARTRPGHLLTIGGGVIGVELSQAFADLGTKVVLLDELDCGFAELSPQVGAIVDRALAARGVHVRRGAAVTHLTRRGDAVLAHVDDGSSVQADRVLVAVGKRARTSGIGLDCLGLAADQPLPVGRDLRVDCPGSVWAIGDVAGRGQYTHLANHHGTVLANQLRGDGTRRVDDVVTPSCVFTAPPVISVGPTRAELADDADVVWAEHTVDELPRSSTDALGAGFLAVAARRSTGAVVAAHGVGDRFDELIHALVVAIDGKVAVDTLARSMQPFPTIGEILGAAFRTLRCRLQPEASVVFTAHDTRARSATTPG